MVEPETCRLCGRKVRSEEGYCSYHRGAHVALRAGFSRWRDAYGRLTYEQYLERLLERPETGIWVREIAERELKNSQEGGVRWV